ncbi:MAG: hypothetical protein V3T62_06260 [Alphaproteobacteria bacterium]
MAPAVRATLAFALAAYLARFISIMSRASALFEFAVQLTFRRAVLAIRAPAFSMPP